MDLHLHTCLSPCAQRNMTPPVIVERAIAQSLDAIGIADHNSAANVGAVKRAGARAGLAVLGGMEIASREEVHLLAFFDEEEALRSMDALVRQHLSGENDPEFFGLQELVDADGLVRGVAGELLAGSTDLTVGEIVRAVHDREGLAIASHIDRPSYSIIAQLGFIPTDLPLDGVELSPRAAGYPLVDREALTGGRRWATFSDAHQPDDVGSSFTVFRVERPTVSELRDAFRGERGRGIEH